MKNNITQDIKADVLIVGGGLVGASLAIALKNSGLKIVIAEAVASEQLQSSQFDARSLALAESSQKILQSLNLWSEIHPLATPIKKIHVSKQKVFGRTLLDADNHKTKAFGYVCELSNINKVLQPELLKLNNVKYLCPARLTKINQDDNSTHAEIELDNKIINIKAQIVVAADGTHSYVRKLLQLQKETVAYNQSAIVANIGLQRSHQNIAYERFTTNGLIAMLPMTQQRSSLVWATSPEREKELLSYSDNDFRSSLQHEFGYRLGRLTKIGRRSSFPLSLQVMPQPFVDRVVFIGNASQTLHPVAGQGFNLGLRDVAILAELLNKVSLQNVVSLKCKYQELRSIDRNKIVAATDRLVKWFGLNNILCQQIQMAGFLLLDLVSPLQELLAYYAMGYSYQNSKLACDIPLDKFKAVL